MKDDKVKVLKAKLATAKFYLGMSQHAQQGMYPHPNHKKEEILLKDKVAKLEAELKALEAKDK